MIATEGAEHSGRGTDLITQQIIVACIEVHRTLDPGLLRSINEEDLCHEFSLRAILYRR